MWRLRLSEVPPGQLDFALYPWIVSNEKLKQTLGWTPRYSSRETFEITMRAQGKLEADRGERLSPVAVDLDRREPAAAHLPDVGGLLARRRPLRSPSATTLIRTITCPPAR